VAENDDDFPADPDFIVIGLVYGYESRVAFEAEAGTTYRIAVDGLSGDTGESPATGAVTLSWALGQGNDHFDNAFEISSAEGIAIGSTKGATYDVGEPDHLGLSTGASIWWRWTAPSSGPATFGLVRSDEEDTDTLLVVYEGSAVDALLLVAHNEPLEFGMPLEDSVTVEASEGTTYWIAIDGAFGETPDVVLRWTRNPENDDFADAFELVGPAGMTTGDLVFGTVDPWADEPDHGGEPGGASVWWRWTAPASGPVTFDTFGSNFDTILAVYTGDEVIPDGFPFPILDLTPVASNDDAGDGSQSQVEFEAVAGATYRIAVANFDYRERGDIVLHWLQAAAPAEPLRIEGLSMLGDRSFRFVLRGPPGASGRIYRNNGLAGWQEWRPFTLEAGAMEVTDAEAPASPARFYRAVSP
jgi:hypothetical protein